MSAKSKTFTYESNGNKFTIPSFSSLPTRALRKSRKATDEMDKAFTILEEAIGADSKEIAIIDEMTVEEFGEFVQAWTGGAPVGESSDS